MQNSLAYNLLLLLLFTAAASTAAGARLQKSPFLTCSQTSNYYDAPAKVLRSCKLAIDGSIHRHPHTKSGCALTNKAAGQMWKGYFAQPVSLTKIRLLSRDGKVSARQSTNLAVEAYDGKRWHRCNTLKGLYKRKMISCRVKNARIVRLRRLSRDHLALCEVEAFVRSSSQTPKAPKQLAFGSCTQSSTWHEKSNRNPRPCILAMDGALERNAHGRFGCAITKSASGSAWYGYFANPVHLTNVAILGRNSRKSMSQSTNISVEVNDGRKWRRCATIRGLYAFKLVGCRVRSVRILRIRRLSKQHLTLCEVEVYGQPSESPVVRQRQVKFASCSQTSTYVERKSKIRRTCKAAIDGNLQRNPHAAAGCAITNSGNAQSWSGLFTRAVSLQRIRLTARSSRPAMIQSTNVVIEVNDGVKWRQCAIIRGLYASRDVTCRAKNVKAVRVRRIRSNHLTLCEVQAFRSRKIRCRAGKFLPRGAKSCSRCPTLRSSRNSAACYRRLRFKSCRQWPRNQAGQNYACSKAADGRVTGRRHGRGCSATYSSRHAKWIGYLPKRQRVMGVVLWSVLGHYSDESTGVKVWARTSSGWRVCGTVTRKYDRIAVACNMNANAIKVARFGYDVNYLSLCEVQVYGRGSGKA